MVDPGHSGGVASLRNTCKSPREELEEVAGGKGCLDCYDCFSYHKYHADMQLGNE